MEDWDTKIGWDTERSCCTTILCKEVVLEGAIKARVWKGLTPDFWMCLQQGERRKRRRRRPPPG